MNLIAVQASMALGSAFWGWLASLEGTRVAMLAAGGTHAGASCAVNRRVRLKMGDEADVTPSMHLPDLVIAVEPLPDDGPVLIQIEYRIDAENVERFLEFIHKVERIRRRNGASDWRVFRDLGRGRTLRRALHHPVVGRIRAAAHPDDDGRPRTAGPGGRPAAGRACRCACRG